MQQVVLTLADAPTGGGDPTVKVTAWLEAHLQIIYGVAHPDPVAELTPFVEATYQAVTATSVNASHVDPAFAQQLRHTLNLDGRPAAGTPAGPPDVHWDIGHEWKPPPPRKRTRAANTGPKSATKSKAENPPSQGRANGRTMSGADGGSMARSTPRTRTTRLDRLEAVVRAARHRQQSRISADDAADVEREIVETH